MAGFSNRMDVPEILRELNAATGARLAMVTDAAGRVLASDGGLAGIDPAELARTVAELFAAARRTALYTGERRCNLLLQQGDTRHLLAARVSDQAVLAVVFEGAQHIGHVRYAARKAVLRLAERTAAPAAPKAGLEAFREYALSLLDRILASK